MMDAALPRMARAPDSMGDISRTPPASSGEWVVPSTATRLAKSTVGPLQRRVCVQLSSAPPLFCG